MTDHEEAAREHLAKAAEGAADQPLVHLGIAGVHAALHLADVIRHGLRDIVYEIRD